MSRKIRPIEHTTFTDGDIVRTELGMLDRGLSLAERNAEWLRLSDRYDIDTTVNRFLENVERGGGKYGEQYDLYRRLGDLLSSRQAGGRKVRIRRRTMRRRRRKRKHRQRRKTL